MYSIGEFSRITGLSVKTLRFYHDKGLLKPFYVDAGSGYRYYDGRCVEKAQVIVRLRNLEFSLKEITDILEQYDDESEILEYLQSQQDRMEQRVEAFGEIARRLGEIIYTEKEVREIMKSSSFEIEEKVVEPMLIAGVRMKGKYSDCGKGFSKIGRHFGRFISGKPLTLHYDSEFRDDADFEVCMPIRQAREAEGISVRELPGGRCIALLHQGPYEELGRSYAKITDDIKQRGLKTLVPSREVYFKGPGMIFRGNPKKYLTEIQFLIDES